MKDCRLRIWITTGQGKHFSNEDGITEGKMEILRRKYYKGMHTLQEENYLSGL